MNLKTHLYKFILLLNFFLVGCASMPPTKNIPAAHTKYTIYFIYRGWHTSILLDATLIAAQAPQLAADLQGQKYARIGWGDGDYFTGKNKSALTAAKALVASGYSAVQLLTYDYEPFNEIPAQTLVPLAITDEGLQRLIAYMSGSIAVDPQGKLVRLSAFSNATGSFFQSKDHYSVLSNCNTWSGNALRVAGLPVANRLTAQGVFEQARFISQWQIEQGLVKKR
jgi:uncharacterized protein (TIGR02117 family)